MKRRRKKLDINKLNRREQVVFMAGGLTFLTLTVLYFAPFMLVVSIIGELTNIWIKVILYLLSTLIFLVVFDKTYRKPFRKISNHILNELNNKEGKKYA